MNAAQLAQDQRVARACAAVFGFTIDMAPEIFFRPTRGASAESKARQILGAVIRRVLGQDVSVERIGRAMGRHRTTLAHALEEIEKACEEDAGLDAFVERHADIARALLGISAFTTTELDARVAAARELAA